MYKRFFIIAISFCAVFLMSLFSVHAMTLGQKDAIATHSYPRIANAYLRWDLQTDAEVAELARWDVVIIDAEAGVYTPERLTQLKNSNPNLILLAYIPAQSLRSNSAEYVGSLRKERFSYVPANWYLYDTAHHHVSNWPDTWILNISEAAPLYNGMRFNEYLPNFVTQKILSNPVWDGVFYDNVFDSLSWLSSSADFNNDGRADSAENIDSAWQAGMNKIIRLTKEQNPNSIVITNGGMAYLHQSDGLMFENFDATPYGDWVHTMTQYLHANNDFNSKVTIINANTSGVADPTNYSLFRYGLTSTLLSDGYFSFDVGWFDHSQLWRYDEYEYSLGVPRGDAFLVANTSVTTPQSGVWRRDFSEGVVVVNATDTSQSVNLGAEFEHIHGGQDPHVNSGLVAQTVQLAPRDGVVLLRPLDRIRSATFQNGSLLRIFNENGNVTRTAFYSYENLFPGDVRIASHDIDGDGVVEFIVSEDNYVKIVNNNGSLRTLFYPYTKTFPYNIDFQVADLEGDGRYEIITAPLNGGPHIRIFNMDGRLLTPGFFAYAKNFRGGAHVAVGDLDGDGVQEIIVGAGYGGGPHVRIFNKDGRLLTPGFFAYDTKFRGGVYVAVGDVNGDGKSEIVTGAGPGGGPQVRIFDGEGSPLSPGFFPFDKNTRDGVRVMVDNIDALGAWEILVNAPLF